MRANDSLSFRNEVHGQIIKRGCFLIQIKLIFGATLLIKNYEGSTSLIRRFIIRR